MGENLTDKQRFRYMAFALLGFCILLQAAQGNKQIGNIILVIASGAALLLIAASFFTND